MNIVEQINEVSGMFTDDLSKKILNARLTKTCYGTLEEFAHCLSSENCAFAEKTQGNILTAEYTSGETVILYGAGARGQWLYHKMKTQKPQVNFLFCDSNFDSLKEDAFLKDKIISPDTLFAEYKDHKVVICIDDFTLREAVFSLLSEQGMKHILAGIIYELESYFDEVVKFTEEEIFVDAGVLNGETSLEFAEKCNHNYKKIYLFEADASFEETIATNIASLKNTELHMKGLWDKEATLSFQSLEGGSGNFSDAGTIKMDVVSLDEVLKGDPITYLKMDIEGAELKALQGARNTIQTHKPKLAICVYHKPEDILEIPLYIKSLVPDYKFYLRQYSNMNNETVLYAVMD